MILKGELALPATSSAVSTCNRAKLILGMRENPKLIGHSFRIWLSLSVSGVLY